MKSEYKRSISNTVLFAVTNHLGIMKVVFVIVTLYSLALAQECPDVTPVVCGPDDMFCGGGFDAAGCPMPNTCVPMTGIK